MKNNMKDLIMPTFEEIKDGINSNMVYVGGHMLNKANADQRIKEANTIRSLGYKVWNPIEDTSINEKEGLSKHTNDNLSKRIVRNDTIGILKSEHIVIEPETFAIGSCVEVGMVFGYKHVASMIEEILNKNCNDKNALIRDLNTLVNICDKNVYTHLDDIRSENNIEELNYNRSWGVNQFLRGVSQALTNTEDGFYQWEDIIKQITELKEGK